MNNAKSLLSRSHLILFFLFSISIFSRVFAYGASWPLFRGTPERTGTLIEQARPPLVPKWSFQVHGGFVSSPVVYKGIVYCGARDFNVWAWDACSGAQKWNYSCGGWVDATPLVTSSTVYVPCRDRNLYALDRLTGNLLWETYTGSLDCSSPVLYQGYIYFLSGYPEKRVYCVNASNGNISRTYPVSRFGFSSPAVINNLMFFGTNDGQFQCLDLASGNINWTKQTEGGIFYCTFAVNDTYVYAVSGGDERRIYCFTHSGTQVWRSAEFNDTTAAVSSVSLGGDKVFVATSFVNMGTGVTDLRLLAFPAAGAGDLNNVPYSWSTTVGTPHASGIISSPACADGVIYIGSGDGRLYCVDASSGSYIEPGTGNLSSVPTGYYLNFDQSISTGIVSSPCVSNGWVYANTYDGNFWAFQAQRSVYVSRPDNNDTVVNSAHILGTMAGPGGPGYKIEYGQGTNPSAWSEILSSAAAAQGQITAQWDTTALRDGSYSMKLTAQNDPAQRAINSFTVNNSPPAPSKLAAADTAFDGGGSLTLNWRTSADDGAGNKDVAGYNVYKSTFNGGFSFIKRLPAGSTAYVDQNCPLYTTYYFVVTAFDAASESGYSNPAWAYSLIDGVEITPNGGAITLVANGLTTEVDFAPGAVANSVWVGITIPTNYSNSGILDSARSTNIVREFVVNPPGTQFLKPVIVKIPYTSGDVANIGKENLRIYWWDTGKNEWRIVNTSDPNSEDGRVWASLNHFSTYRIMGYSPGHEPLLSADKVYAYPNPAKGQSLFFKYYLGDKADVFVDVYNVAGGLVAHLEKQANPAGIVSELEWDISKKASGIYIFRLEARTGSENKAIKKKLAIVH